MTVKAIDHAVLIRAELTGGVVLTPDEARDLAGWLWAAAAAAEQYEEPSKRLSRERRERKRARLATTTQGGRA